MPPPEKQVCVFISSTFRDMHAERDHLVTFVFPELRERVEQLGLGFFDVDLRWGVPARGANGETANSWEYCRQWIDRVEPFFVCILGQRYGWVPEPEQLKAEEDRRRQQDEERSITDMEVRHAVLNTKLKRRSYFYLRTTESPATVSEYVDPPPLLLKLAKLKAEVRSCGRPVRDYQCGWTGSGFAGMEEFGRRVLDDLWSGVLRDERYVSKDVWWQALGKDPNSDPLYTDESQPVPLELTKTLVALAKPPPKEPLDAEREQMEAFAVSRLRWFQSRTHELQQLTGFIHSTAVDAPRLAIVAAVPGQGKSALIAKLSTAITQPSTFLITHFVGATERSATAYSLVERLLGELDRSGIEWPPDEQKKGEEPKRDFNSLCFRLAQRLGDYAGERHIVILLDALNQLTDGHDLHWLPNRLAGPSVRIVVSCVEDATAEAESAEHRVLHALALRRPAPLRVQLGALTEDDVRVIVIAYLKEYCKELDREHVDAICHLEQTKNPLYLLVMLAELRTLGGNDMNQKVPGIIASMARDHPDTVSLFRWVLQRLEVFGKEAVQWWCLYLAHGRVGMASQELADLVARRLSADAAATALRIERGLRRYLQRRGTQLDFFHGQLRQAVFEQYGPQAEAAKVHHEMADYFTGCAKGNDPQKEWETNSVRGFAECVFHLTKAGRYDQAAELLSNFPFLLHKLRLGLLEGVFEDYDMIRREASVDIVGQIEIWTTFFREKAHFLRRGSPEWPTHKILLQLAVEHADDSPLTQSAEKWLTEGRCDWLWLRRVPRLAHVHKDQCLAVLEGHTHSGIGAMALADGRLLSWSCDGTLRLWDSHSGKSLAVLEGHSALALEDGRLLSWSSKTLRLWSNSSGKCLAVLKGHTNEVDGALALGHGRLLSWSYKTLRLWNSQSGKCLAVFKGHTGYVCGALALADGRLLSWSDDKTLRLWDGHSGKCLALLKGHTHQVEGALQLVDGRLLSWSMDKTLRLWNNRSGKCLAVLKGHIVWGVKGALALADGRLLSWSSDKTLRLWNSQSGKCRAVLEGHTSQVEGALPLADGRLLSWSRDKTLRFWNVDSGKCLAVLEGHTDGVIGALALADGRLLSWSRDTTLRVWDGHNGACLAVLEGHSEWVEGALALGDGRLLSWSEDKTLRVWDGHCDARQSVLEGHNRQVHGLLALADGRLLSWSRDKTLRLWDRHSGKSLAVLKGHTEWCVGAWVPGVSGALELADGRLLSWSDDKTLRLWNSHNGECLAVLEGHTHYVIGALALADGRLLSWSMDSMLRFWDGHGGVCLAMLAGHTVGILGALALGDGRLLSWSPDKTLRLWDSYNGKCLAVLGGHMESVEGALVLADGRLLSWSDDKTLRLWNSHNGKCLTVLEGHAKGVSGALELADGRLLSWSRDMTSRLWAGYNGKCLAAVAKDLVASRHPEWLHARVKAQSSGSVVGDFFAADSTRSMHLRYKTISSILTAWNADSDSEAPCLLTDGTAVVIQANGQVCILKLHHGNRRVTLAEAEELLPQLRKKS